ncbi:hypothetical protein BC832DRAFT_313109 [Gaertneriomyces semiglobifer]|nr:hypothetical protein BC832DRAFT_313109 [Gaertneriomyces semiglobifer]
MALSGVSLSWTLRTGERSFESVVQVKLCKRDEELPDLKDLDCDEVPREEALEASPTNDDTAPASPAFLTLKCDNSVSRQASLRALRIVSNARVVEVYADGEYCDTASTVGESCGRHITVLTTNSPLTTSLELKFCSLPRDSKALLRLWSLELFLSVADGPVKVGATCYSVKNSSNIFVTECKLQRVDSSLANALQIVNTMSAPVSPALKQWMNSITGLPDESVRTYKEIAGLKPEFQALLANLDQFSPPLKYDAIPKAEVSNRTALSAQVQRGLPGNDTSTASVVNADALSDPLQSHILQHVDRKIESLKKHIDERFDRLERHLAQVLELLIPIDEPEQAQEPVTAAI